MANVSELQLQIKCLTAGVGGVTSEKTSLQGLYSPSLFDHSYEHVNPKSRQVLWVRPVAGGKVW